MIIFFFLNPTESKKPLVAVTGASGYIASVLIKHLFDQGYQVNGSVRNLNDKEKVQHLHDLFPKLQLFEADLLKPGWVCLFVCLFVLRYSLYFVIFTF